MISCGKKRQQNGRFLSQLDDFDRDLNIGDPVRSERENVIVNDSLADPEFIGISKDSLEVPNENTVDVQALERSLLD